MKKIAILAAVLVCLPFMWSAAAQANLILNGSFESGIAPGNFTTIYAGDSTSITDWTVTSGSVDYIGTYWTAADGSRSLDMNGLAPGQIAQTFNTAVGQAYRVTFALAGNFDGDPNPKTMTVIASVGGSTQSFTFSEPANWSHNNMGWVPKTYDFTAADTTTTLTFTGDPTVISGWPNGTPYGPTLDNVDVTAVPVPPTVLLLGSGLVGLLGLRRFRKG
jgi:choice-of-anchor C domain-containing protein